jgi:hypothetical protein
MQTLKQKLSPFWWGVLFLIILGAITYLPLVNQLGYINDDWYLMFAGQVGGADFFHEVFRVDRPLRGYVMQAAFSIFGMNPLYYHLSAFVLRVLSAIGLLWLLDQLWSHRGINNWVAALLFLVYPGFLSQVNPIDYQSQIFSLACAIASLMLTVKAVRAEKIWSKAIYILSSVALAWVYLGLVEYFLGFEALRLAVVAILTLRKDGASIPARLWSVFRAYLPLAVGAGGFLVWRLFFFEAERQATDVGAQLSLAFSAPLTILRWLISLLQDVFHVTTTAWTIPLNLFGFSLRLRDSFTGLALMSLALFFLFVFLRDSGENDKETAAGSSPGGMREQVWTALIMIVAGLIPVILVNRRVVFPEYSRYALASSVGVAILFSSLLDKINSASLRNMGIALLLGISVLTHHGRAVQVAYETNATNNFWWQAAWRAPKIEEGVTLIVSYPGSPMSEDYFAWGPANLIYYPEKQDANPLVVKLPAAILTGDAINKITTGGGIEAPLRRGNYLERNYGSILLMIQTHPNGCVRFINGDAPELSQWDAERLVLVAPYSQLDAVVTEGESAQPPTVVFGDEPEHGWCYYYQKADLARQRGAWDNVLLLLDEALDNGHYPNDTLEWMPFLQAYAAEGDMRRMREITNLVIADKVQRVRVCQVMSDFSEKETLSTDAEDFIRDKICN